MIVGWIFENKAANESVENLVKWIQIE